MSKRQPLTVDEQHELLEKVREIAIWPNYWRQDDRDELLQAARRIGAATTIAQIVVFVVAILLGVFAFICILNTLFPIHH